VEQKVANVSLGGALLVQFPSLAFLHWNFSLYLSSPLACCGGFLLEQAEICLARSSLMGSERRFRFGRENEQDKSSIFRFSFAKRRREVNLTVLACLGLDFNSARCKSICFLVGSLLLLCPYSSTGRQLQLGWS